MWCQCSLGAGGARSPPPPHLCVSETPCLSQIFKGDRRDSLKGVPGGFSLGGLSTWKFPPTVSAMYDQQRALFAAVTQPGNDELKTT